MASLMTVEAIYRNGMIKPLVDLHLRENERVRLRIERRSANDQKATRNIAHLRGIWKGHLTAAEKEGNWVSDTVAAIRRESDQKIAKLALSIDKALLHNAQP